ncbi:MAG: hypothetical protein DRJ66_02390 [Thermoprotei archaeon]|mgnify:CR=1 FL=1|nr:MAG: hypothetical protein DRJ66_02390 [Thermoprotei archaeon]RLF18493.1 MAG: hypothetical protein DRZ82_08125 [Thermoprotei archaeon]
MSSKEYRPKVLNDYTDVCPSCLNKSLRIVEALHEIPYVGRILIISTKCDRCGYKHVDVFNIEQGKPIRISYKVKDVRDLSARIIRSMTATIKIPELGLMIEPGPLSQGEITTIEGYIIRFLDLLDLLCEDKVLREEIRKKLELALEGKFTFTFIIEDPLGNSSMVVPRAKDLKIEPLKPDEVRKLKYGELILELRRREDVKKET